VKRVWKKEGVVSRGYAKPGSWTTAESYEFSEKFLASDQKDP
jgi:hypothetical protein